MLPSNIFHSLSCLPSLSIEYWSSEEKMIFENTLVYSLLCIPSIEWSYEEEKIFDNSLVEFGLNCPDLFQRIATRLPRKSVLQIKEHLGELVEDIEMITGSRKNPEIPIPTNKASETCGDRVAVAPAVTEKPSKKRGRGYEWTEEEHELFLKGLEKHGHGAWSKISRDFVLTRSYTQVASHAQKYFIRKNSGAATKRTRKRSTSSS
ncbi:transcription factor DIVARICATA-like [Fagus crenata]